MKFCEENHIVNGWVHADINGSGVTSDVISLKNYGHVAIVLDFGNTTAGGDADITVYAADDVAGTHTAAMNNYVLRKSPGSTSDDAFAAEVAIADSKIDYVAGGEIVPNTDDDSIVVIDIEATQVKAASDDYSMDCVYVTFGNPGAGCPVGCKFILSQPRYAAGTLPSAIAD
jgi:hypothetical protein